MSTKKQVMKDKKIAPPEKLTQWSFSRWACYENCPRKTKLQYIDGYRGVSGEASDRGTDIHAMAEAYLKARRAIPLAPVLQVFADEFKALRKGKAQAELELAFDCKWLPCEWDAPASWLRMKIDAIAMLDGTSMHIVDFKTGKLREYHTLQLSLYALAVFITRPHIQKITAELWYIDHAKKTKVRYDRREMDTLKKLWEQRILCMFNDTRFAPTPNPLCSWCICTKSNGLCEFAK